MSNINLLPWREADKKKKKQLFISLLFFSGLVVFFLSYWNMLYIDNRLQIQLQRNQFLQEKIILIDTRIVKIKSIKKEKKELERRINLIHKLEYKRNEVTHLFNTLSQGVPNGIYLQKVSFIKKKVSLQGESESYNHVSNLLRKIENSDWLGDVHLNSIVTTNNTAFKWYKFAMEFKVMTAKRGVNNGLK